MERQHRRAALPLVLCCWGFALSLLLSQSSPQDFVGAVRPALKAGVALRAAGEDEGAGLDEGTDKVRMPPREKDRLTENLRNRLRAEAQAMGDENTPITAGFGNPYLLISIIVVVLGVASYFSLGLDKLTATNTNMSDKEMEQRYMQMQSSMYGGGGR